MAPDYKPGHLGCPVPETLFHRPFGVIFLSISSVLWARSRIKKRRKGLGEERGCIPGRGKAQAKAQRQDPTGVVLNRGRLLPSAAGLGKAVAAVRCMGSLSAEP